ncbi:alanine racemase [Clostridia bacterium]|nr:alanine racemase [Clostridia bacterium]
MGSLNGFNRSAGLTIDLSAIRHNAVTVLSRVPKSVLAMAVVKANAYGHGDIDVARVCIAAGYSWLGVAFAHEGVRLRKAGIETPILILGAPDPLALADVISYGLTQTVFLPEHIRSIDAEAERQGKRADVHIKIDTGMARIGVCCFNDSIELDGIIGAIKSAGAVMATGAFTHLAVADEDGEPHIQFTLEQIERFARVGEKLKQTFPRILLHASNSAGTLRYPGAAFDMVRVGIALYGSKPGTTDTNLKGAMRWVARATNVKRIAPNTTIGYGRTFEANRPVAVMTVPVGYADGYHRAGSNKGFVLVRGKLCPIIGRICMDQFMADVTDVQGASIGDEVVLLGSQDGAVITGDDLATWWGTISYEVFCSISGRVPRVTTD